MMNTICEKRLYIFYIVWENDREMKIFDKV